MKSALATIIIFLGIIVGILAEQFLSKQSMNIVFVIIAGCSFWVGFNLASDYIRRK